MSEKKTSVVLLPPSDAGCLMDHSASAWIVGAGAVEGEAAAVPGPSPAAQHSTARCETGVYEVEESQSGWHENDMQQCCGLSSSETNFSQLRVQKQSRSQSLLDFNTRSHPLKQSPCMCILGLSIECTGSMQS